MRSGMINFSTSNFWKIENLSSAQMTSQKSEKLNYDVAVVGAGSGGSTVARYLAKAGKNVIVFERGIFPGFHIGESLLPHNIPLLEELGLKQV